MTPSERLGEESGVGEHIAPDPVMYSPTESGGPARGSLRIVAAVAIAAAGASVLLALDATDEIPVNAYRITILIGAGLGALALLLTGVLFIAVSEQDRRARQRATSRQLLVLAVSEYVRGAHMRTIQADALAVIRKRPGRSAAGQGREPI